MKKAVKNLSLLMLLLVFCAAVGITVGCPLKRIFGIPCPGCGMTRACLSMLSFNFKEMLFFHPLAPLVPFMGAVFVFKDTAIGSRIWNCTPFLAALLIAVLLTYIIRMVLYFPSAPPMNLENNSFFIKILHKILLQ